MKIGIITFHFAYNYGAALQSWALQHTLQSMCDETDQVEIINYRPDYHTSRYSVFINPFREKSYSLAKKIRVLISNYKILSRYQKAVKFREFEKKLNLTPECKTLEDAIEICKDFELLICGSDQIWNMNLTDNKFDDMYFARIPGISSKKATYAISAGEVNLEDYSEEIRKYLADFVAISCRENKTKKELVNITGRTDITVVPDPTLLIAPEVYNSIMCDDKPKENTKYILVYKLDDNELLESAVTKTYEREKLPVINISPSKLLVNIPHKWKHNIGPSEFVELIRNAEIVVTNSFHGTVFSLLYQKKVIVVPHFNRNERIINLLKSVNAEQFLVSSEDDVARILDSYLDYDEISTSIHDIREHGMMYLQRCIHT